MRSVALSVVFIILLSLGASPVAAGMGGTADGPLDGGEAVATPAIESDQTTAQATDSPEPPSTTFTINLQSDRSADWVVTVEYELTSDAEREAFREIAEEFESGTASSGLDVSLYENLAAQASSQTDRSMAIESVERSSTLQGTTGTLRLSFRWTEFLAEDGEKLVLNDTLRTSEENAWLTSLDENQELRITTPRGYAITSANVAFSDNTVVIEGPHTFDPDELVEITLEPSLGPSWELLAAALVVGVAIVGGALLLRRETDPSNGGPQATADANTNGGVDTVEGTPEPPAEPEPDDPSEPTEDLSLLADDERVLRLLKRNGGRMRQAEIVSETQWSDAKVSQLLSSMADDDEITKLRIGRENLISLPDVDALDGSPVDDEDDER